ncbi:DnaD domain-containing protein [Numidum massiliense]|uniref:DnaD domain-containing protein n=1 Tax=Numidum massiliense TaxID=1522315 RepID=UPI00093ADC11|nr:DnaD domain-containing protein [Numidum massiliense]
MNRDHFRELTITTLQSGTVNIPHGLLKFYKKLQLSDVEAMLLIHIFSFQANEGKSFPTIHELQERMTVPEHELVQSLQQLVSKRYIGIVNDTDAQGLRTERYDLQPLYEKLADCYTAEGSKQLAEAQEARETGILTTFEAEFGRPLSPMECETLVKWLDEDGLPDELILAALKEAVFAGKLNFRYIDRILLEWKRNRVHTVEQAQQYARNFRKKGAIYQGVTPRRETDDFPFYNWVKS